MKFIIIALLLPLSAFSMGCQVDGISDSPQKLSCFIQTHLDVGKIELTCRNLNYNLKWEKKNFPVMSAYHEEVETGPTPLVFVTPEFNLTIVFYRFYGHAYLTLEDEEYSGLCFTNP